MCTVSMTSYVTIIINSSSAVCMYTVFQASPRQSLFCEAVYMFGINITWFTRGIHSTAQLWYEILASTKTLLGLQTFQILESWDGVQDFVLVVTLGFTPSPPLVSCPDFFSPRAEKCSLEMRLPPPPPPPTPLTTNNNYNCHPKI